jgi:uncharacterized membrane protein YdbT with pleckstrin-like domain
MGYIDSLMGRNEKIVFIDRQHWLVLAWALLVDVLVAVFIVAAAVILAGLNDKLGFLMVLIVLVVFPVVHFVVRYLNWYNEQYLVTNRRVIKIRGVINKLVSDSSLEKVNDVVLEQSIVGRILGYGTVQIITGSDIGVDIFKHIARPVHFKTEMLNQKEDLAELDSYGARARRVLAEESPTSGDIPELIAELDELREKGIVTDEEFEKKKADLLGRI